MSSSYFKQEVRRGQLISPWGVGAIVPFPKNASRMIAGLDMWEFGSDPAKYVITDDRLVKRLGIAELREPPANLEDGMDTRLTIPAVRFPLWHYCPICGKMKKLNFTSEDQFCSGDEKPHRQEKMIPERFVAICDEGHIEDFPVMEWVHGGSFANEDNTHVITRETTGSTTTLAAVRYKCSCGAHKSLQGATKDKALAEIDIHCHGSQPWLNGHEDCDRELKVVQAGGSNVWFPITKSSIWIPRVEGDITIQETLRKHHDVLFSTTNPGEMPEDMRIEIVAQMVGMPFEKLKKALEQEVAGKEEAEITEATSEEEYRLAEYDALCNGTTDDNGVFVCRHLSIENYDESIQSCFDGISLVQKLQETRAFVGFSRVDPGEGKNVRKLISKMSVGHSGWIPAIRVFGEGLFLKFNKEQVCKWVSNPSVVLRAEMLTDKYNVVAARWGRERVDINPAYVLIHTFAHTLINRLSFDCGYGSSSIRERIYCDFSGFEHDMCGLLIYTASGDSEGSLGGLVRMGKPGRLEGVILRALDDARWCSSDPVCSQSNGQGPDSCNLAACHNCALLPETCCEKGNRVLDRLMMIGQDEFGSFGYFKGEI